ncbi:MAG: radical SAM protein [Pseudonocardiaceae bacterium]
MKEQLPLLTLRAWKGGPALTGPDLEEIPRFGSPDVANYGAVGLTASPDAEIDSPTGINQSEQMESRKSPDGTRNIYDISMLKLLPLVGHLAHHQIDGDHLWIAVEDGKLIVADETDNELMTSFVGACSPADAALRLQQVFQMDHSAARDTVAKFIARLAAAGLVKGIRGYHSVKKVRPHKFARFHLTQRCQLQCTHCYTSSSPHLPKDGELPVERWIQLVDEFAENGGAKILFTGGEALVYRGCIDVMRRAHDVGLEVTLFSNGMLVPRYLNELKSVADIVQISVDGPSEKSHDAIRGRHSFKRAIRAIRLLLDAGIDTRVSTTIMSNNWDEIKNDLPNFIAEFDDTNLSFRISYGAMAHGRGTELDHSLDTEEVRKFVDSLLSRVKTTENRDAGPNAVQKISGCGYAEQLVIAPDGLVYPCHLLSGALGHVDQLPIRDITKYLTRTAEAFSVNNRVGCSTCDLRNLCGGSCRVEDEKHTGSRLVTTCTPEEKLRKKRFLVRRYRPVVNTE